MAFFLVGIVKDGRENQVSKSAKYGTIPQRSNFSKDTFKK